MRQYCLNPQYAQAAKRPRFFNERGKNKDRGARHLASIYFQQRSAGEADKVRVGHNIAQTVRNDSAWFRG